MLRAPGRAALIASTTRTMMASVVVASTSSWCCSAANATSSGAPYLRSISPLIWWCLPSTLCVKALPRSWTSAAYLAVFTFAPTSSAMIPAICAISVLCFSTFWPYDVRNFSSPSSSSTSRGIPMIPTSRAASSPARTTSLATFFWAFSTTSSIRPGWTRPSLSSSSSAWRATSRRTGSKLLRIIMPGVSSTMISTPVARCSAWILRPSLPMIRPFISSSATLTTETVYSAM